MRLRRARCLAWSAGRSLPVPNGAKSVSEKVRSCLIADVLRVISPAFQRGVGRRQDLARPAPSGRKRLADLRAAGEGGTQILSLEPSRWRSPPDAGCFGQVTLVVRAGTSANETGVGTQPLRRAFVARPASSLPADDDRVRFVSASAAAGQETLLLGQPPPRPTLPEIRRRLRRAFSEKIRCSCCPYRAKAIRLNRRI